MSMGQPWRGVEGGVHVSIYLEAKMKGFLLPKDGGEKYGGLYHMFQKLVHMLQMCGR